LPIHDQSRIWNDAWEEFAKKYHSEYDKSVILSLHAVYVHATYGTRTVIDTEKIIKDFQPTLIVTLIDDVYDKWWRTEARNVKDVFAITPSHEQLIMARRDEILLGEMIALQRTSDTFRRHVICATQHPVEVLRNLICFDSVIVYLSFPISAPREMAKLGDTRFIERINEFHNRIYEKQKNEPHISFISPLAIDELPFQSQILDPESIIEIEEEGKMIKYCEFDRDKYRWSIKDLWKNASLLSEQKPAPVRIPVESAEEIIGNVKSDVGWRDFRLVGQSALLAVFCPINPIKNELARGVRAEMYDASSLRILSFVYQDPELDPTQKAKSIFRKDPGAMGLSKNEYFFNTVDSLDVLLEKVIGHANSLYKDKHKSQTT